MKRQPTISFNSAGLSLSKVIPQHLGDMLSFSVNKDTKQIIISKDLGEHMALVTYPETIPMIKSAPLITWIKKELGDRNYRKMLATWDGEKFIVQTNEKENAK